MMAESVATDQIFIIVIMGSSMGARSNNRHVALQHVEKLRQLVDARLTQPRTDIRHSRVAANRLSNVRAIVERSHGAKLEDLELLTVEPVPRLHEECRARRVKFDRKGDD